VVIDRPVDEVWAFMEDFRNYRRWQSGLVAMQQINAGPMGIGARIAVVHQFLGRRLDLILEVTGYEPGRAFAATVTAGPVRFRGTWRYELLDGARTHISGLIEGETEGFFKLAEPLVAHAAKRQIDADCATLKELVEASSAAPVTISERPARITPETTRACEPQASSGGEAWSRA
jgi:uncharacterized membrane protein